MEDVIEEISDTERERRRKISEYRKRVIKEKREKGLKEYQKRRKKEKALKEKKKLREKEKEKKRKEREAEKKKHKKPVGRPKKRGPKKKYKRKKKVLKKRGKKPMPPISYKIISCKNGKQNKLIGKYRNIEDAYEVFNKLKENDKNVIFPISSYGNDKLKNSIDEYVLIEKNDTKEASMLRNEYGVIIEHKTNREGWIILDKYRYLKEETFWVLGYDKKSDRKTFLWVFQNLLLNAFTSSYEHKMICTYKNKVVIKSDNGYMDLIFCKSQEDSIRFYNLLEKYSKKNRLKRAIFIGDFSRVSKQRRKLENELIEFTGLTKRKIQMKNTSFFCK